MDTSQQLALPLDSVRADADPEVFEDTELDILHLADGLAAVAGTKLNAEQRRYLEGPLVIGDIGWADTIPKWVIQAIPKARLERVLRESKGDVEGEKATLEEVMAYFYTASLRAPLTHEAAQVYFYVASQVMEKHALTTEQNFWDCLGIREAERGITGYQEREILDRIRFDIRRSVAKRR
jgi:hypothetical protein